MTKKKDNIELNEVQNTESITVQVLEREDPMQKLNTNDVVFEVSYPEDYEGVKKIPSGQIVVSKETADILTNKGIGKIVK